MTEHIPAEERPRVPSPAMLRQWASDPQQNQCWGLAAVADRLELTQELVEALNLLFTEVAASGNADSKDYGWPEAVAKTRASLAKAEGK
jgi:hypothetical protein